MFKPFKNIQSGNMAGAITAQQKTIDIAKNLGNPAAGRMQGSTFEIYDSLPLDGRTSYKFFEGSGSRQFPFTNLDQNNGKLGVGETMTLLYGQILFFTIVPATGAISAITPLSTNLNFLQGEIELIQANQTILKRKKLVSFSGDYNKDALNATNNVFHFNTLLTLQSLMDFSVNVRLPAGTTTANSFVQLILEGTGGLLSTKSNF